MQRLKYFFTTTYSKIILVLTTIVGILLYYINLKNKEINSTKVKLDLLDTEKQADLLETEINEMKEERNRTSKEIKELDKLLVELHNKRELLKEKTKTMSNSEIEDFWNKE